MISNRKGLYIAGTVAIATAAAATYYVFVKQPKADKKRAFLALQELADRQHEFNQLINRYFEKKGETALAVA
jgi:hypothetical protein